jgi:hypothetical protein
VGPVLREAAYLLKATITSSSVHAAGAHPHRSRPPCWLAGWRTLQAAARGQALMPCRAGACTSAGGTPQGDT